MSLTPLTDPELKDYLPFIKERIRLFNAELKRINKDFSSLYNYADLHLHLGMHKTNDAEPCWILREYMPQATNIWLTTNLAAFIRRERYMFKRVSADGWWELSIPVRELPHGTYIELRVSSLNTTTAQRRIPAFALWVEQDKYIKEQWCARVYDPPTDYKFLHDHKRKAVKFPLIYEAHVGIAQDYQTRTPDSVGSYMDFAEKILPLIKAGGYNVVQLMGILEHPLYKSFGYQVSNYFAPSSRFGTLAEFKYLVDKAHELDLLVVLDIPHSHTPSNTEQGLSQYDTSDYFFAAKDNQWGTRSFDYNLEMTRRFLLSNCRYWLEEFHVDGFRFDAVGNMIYIDHGFGDEFNHVGRCFYNSDGEKRIDTYGVMYLSLANELIHTLVPHSLTLAEEFSGMPGMTSPVRQGGLGFDYRFAMGIPDFWAKFIEEGQTMGQMWYELNNRRSYENTVSYVECHDQCINGDDAMIWRLIGDDMYTYMSKLNHSWIASRGVGIYKLMRLLTLCTAGQGYLNFMGNEFGHPEWIDDEAYAHRQWHLATTDHLKYAGLGMFDQALLKNIINNYQAEFKESVHLRKIHEEDRILAFSRGKLLIVCNLHDLKPQENLELMVAPGKYIEILSSDEQKYSGYGNLTINKKQNEHFSQIIDQGYDQQIKLYLPPLTGLILEQS